MDYARKTFFFARIIISAFFMCFYFASSHFLSFHVLLSHSLSHLPSSPYTCPWSLIVAGFLSHSILFVAGSQFWPFSAVASLRAAHSLDPFSKGHTDSDRNHFQNCVSVQPTADRIILCRSKSVLKCNAMSWSKRKYKKWHFFLFLHKVINETLCGDWPC